MKKLWQTSWRVALCGLLLLWTFHSIFVDEARRSTPSAEWEGLARTEQWQRGWTQGPPSQAARLAQVKGGEFALSIVLMGLTIVLSAVRWRTVLAVQGLNLSFGRAFEITLVAHFFNSFLLGSTGGDLMKAYFAARETHHKKTEAVVTVFVDRLLGLWSMLLFAGLMMLPNIGVFGTFDHVTQLASLTVGGMLAACTTVVVLAFWGGLSRRWSGARSWLRRLPKGEWLERSLDSCRRFGEDRWFLVKAIALSMLLNVAIVAQWWVVSRGLGLTLPIGLLMMMVPVVICIAALPVTPAGLGLREALFIHLVSSVAVSGSALSISLLALAGSVCWSLVGGLVYLFFRERHHLREAELEQNGDEPRRGVAS